jgi:hypothetical protein
VNFFSSIVSHKIAFAERKMHCSEVSDGVAENARDFGDGFVAVSAGEFRHSRFPTRKQLLQNPNGDRDDGGQMWGETMVSVDSWESLVTAEQYLAQKVFGVFRGWP